MSQQHLILNRTGDKMPIVGFGTWKVENDKAHDVVYNAIKVGYVSSLSFQTHACDGRALMNDSSAGSYSALSMMLVIMATSKLLARVLHEPLKKAL